MRKLLTTAILALVAVAAVHAQELEKKRVLLEGRQIFGNFGVSLDAGTTGVGATFSTPLGRFFTARAGFGFLPYTYKYKADVLEFNLSEALAEFDIDDETFDKTITHRVDLKGKLNMPATHLLVDYSPFKNGFGAFHVTAGLYMGSRNLIHVNGDANINQLQTEVNGIRDEVYTKYPQLDGLLDIDVRDVMLQVGDAGVHLNPNGTVDAYAKVNAVRPYFGIGWGNAIPKRRVGFRFDIGALYQGKPEITSPNIDKSLRSEIDDDDLNKVLDYAKWWPQISFSLTVRLLKDK